MKHPFVILILLFLLSICAVKEKKYSTDLNKISADYRLLEIIKSRYEINLAKICEIDIKDTKVVLEDFMCVREEVSQNVQLKKLCMPSFVDIYDCIGKFKNLEEINLVGGWEFSKIKELPKKLKYLSIHSVDNKITLNDLYRNLLTIKINTYQSNVLEVIGKKDAKELIVVFEEVKKIDVSKGNLPKLEKLFLRSAIKSNITIDKEQFFKFSNIKRFMSSNITFNKPFIDFLISKGADVYIR